MVNNIQRQSGHNIIFCDCDKKKIIITQENIRNNI